MPINLTKNNDNSNINHILSSNTQSQKADLRITPEITVHSSGNVGIGNTQPDYSLHVNGNMNFSGNIYQNGSLFGSGGGGGNTDNILSIQISSATLVVDSYTGGNMSLAGTITSAGLNITNSFAIKKAETVAANTLLTQNLVGQYTGNSWNTSTNTWTDLSGKGNHAILVTNGSSITVNNITTGSTIKYIAGGVNERIVFPVGILPKRYTLFHVARYNGGSGTTNRGNIFSHYNPDGTQQNNINWVSGFWYGRAGVAIRGYFGTWNGLFITANPNNINWNNNGSVYGDPVTYPAWHNPDNWVISSDKLAMYRSQGVNRTKMVSGYEDSQSVYGATTPDGSSVPQLSVNPWNDCIWAIAEILVYDRSLSESEINRVETYLFDKYSALTKAYTGNDVPVYSTAYPQGSYTSGTTNTFDLLNVSNGNIGIGKSNQSYQLHLNSDDAAKPGSAYWTIGSDERLKTNITLANLEMCYNNIKTIPLKRYSWRDDIYDDEQVPDRNKIGWIAQDVEPVFPKAVSTSEQYNLTDCKSLNVDQLIASMYGCLQKLIERTENFIDRVNILKNN